MHERWRQEEINHTKGQIAALKRSLAWGGHVASEREGQFGHTIGNVRTQIDEIISSEERLTERILLFKSMIDSISLGLLAVDQEGQVILSNDAVTGILGAFQSEVPDNE